MGDISTDDIKLPEVKEPTSDDLIDSKMKLLEPKRQRFVHLYLSGDYTLAGIAELLNVSAQTVYRWAGNPEIKAIIEEVQTQEDELVKQGIKALRLKALYKMGELVDSKVDGIAYQAARDILDRTGHKAPSKQEVNIEVHTFEQQIKEVIGKSNMDKFIDTSYEVVDEKNKI